MSDILCHLEAGLLNRLWSATQFEVGSPSGVLLSVARGHLSPEENSPECDIHTLFDVASLTKAIATTTICMLAIEDRRLSLKAPLSEYIPVSCDSAWGNTPIMALLSHQSGLQAWCDFAHTAGTQDVSASRRRIRNAVLDSSPRLIEGRIDYSECYSDLGFILLDWVLENIYGKSLDHLFRERVAIPFGLTHTRFFPRPHVPTPDDVIPAAALTRTVDGCPLQGIVDDDNCRAMGGVSGHAGLFSTARDLGRFATQLLEVPERIGLAARTRDRFWDYHSENTRFCLGWDKPSGADSLSGRSAKDTHVVGHLGFTGCSIWIDRKTKKYVIFLTNRESCNDNPKCLADIRKVTHRTAWQL